MNESLPIVVVGASAAGMSVATTLRRKGYAGALTVMGDETDLPYDRPPLSKQFLSGSWKVEKLALQSGPALAALGIDLRLGSPAVKLDAASHTIWNAQGESIVYAAAVIATGVRARTIGFLSSPDAYVLRTRMDAERLRGIIVPGLRLVIIGAGFLGLETAATASELGAIVTVVEPQEHPLRNRLGAIVASALLDLHRTRGVTILTGTEVTGFGSSHQHGCCGSARVVDLSNGAKLGLDAVLVAIGSVPNTEWLANSGLQTDNGVVCDAFCRAASDVWAAGDVARWPHLGLRQYLRLEHRTNATEQGQAVAAAIMGQSEAFMPVPFFWTEHYGVRIQMVGVFTPDAVEVRRNVQARPGAFVVEFHAKRGLVGAASWNATRELALYRDRIAGSWGCERAR